MNYDDLIKFSFLEIKPETIIMTPLVKSWCGLPYNDKEGCMNVVECKKIRYIRNLPTLYNHYYLLILKFDLEEYMRLWALKHPDYSEKQLRNVIYYQNKLRSLIKKQIAKYRNIDKVFSSGKGESMEAVGIFVFATLRRNKIVFDLKAKKSLQLVNLLCSNNKVEKVSTVSTQIMSYFTHDQLILN